MIESRKTPYLVLWIFGLTFLFAIVANTIVLCPSPIKFEVAGDANDWIGFYAGAFASLISSGMAFYILHITYKQNEKNHQEQKELQRKSLIYVEKMNAFRKIVELLSELKVFLDPSEFEYIENKYNMVMNFEDKKGEYDADFKKLGGYKLNIEKLCFNIKALSKISFDSKTYSAFENDIDEILSCYNRLALIFKKHKLRTSNEYFNDEECCPIDEWNFTVILDNYIQNIAIYKEEFNAFKHKSDSFLLSTSASLSRMDS